MATSVSTVFDPLAPPCPKCKEPLAGIVETGAGHCGACATLLDFSLFPARLRPKPVARAVRSMEGDATCFFHAQNQAAAICDGCGRYVCTVCVLPGDKGQQVCPPCLSSGRKKSVTKADEIVVYDSLAMTLALVPMLMWPFTVVTAPSVLIVAIYGWRKPRSLIRPGNSRLILAMVIAVLQITGWVGFAIAMWLK